MMKQYMRAGCFVGVLLMSAGLLYCGYQKFMAHKQAQKFQARQEWLASFGILSDGSHDFIPLPPELPHDMRKAHVGAQLFSNSLLARTPKRTCGACHALSEGGSDGRCHGEDTRIPRSVYNAMFAPRYLHDGSLTNLSQVIAHMMLSPNYSGGVSETKMLARLQKDTGVLQQMREIYGAPVTFAHLVDCLRNYMQTLITFNKSFDLYCAGHTEQFGDKEKKGMALFRAHCLLCHDGPALGTLQMKEGVKVPGLRAISLRRAFFGEGSCTNLAEAVQRMAPHTMSTSDQQALTDFLRTL